MKTRKEQLIYDAAEQILFAEGVSARKYLADLITNEIVKALETEKRSKKHSKRKYDLPFSKPDMSFLDIRTGNKV